MPDPQLGRLEQGLGSWVVEMVAARTRVLQGPSSPPMERRHTTEGVRVG